MQRLAHYRFLIVIILGLLLAFPLLGGISEESRAEINNPAFSYNTVIKRYYKSSIDGATLPCSIYVPDKGWWSAVRLGVWVDLHAFGGGADIPLNYLLQAQQNDLMMIMPWGRNYKGFYSDGIEKDPAEPRIFDNFDVFDPPSSKDPVPAADWSVQTGNWRVFPNDPVDPDNPGGFYRQDSTDFGGSVGGWKLAVRNGSSGKNYSVSTRLKIPAGYQNDAKITASGVVFHRQEDNSFYLVDLFKQQKLDAGGQPYDARQLRVYKRVNGTWAKLHEKSLDWSDDTWYELKAITFNECIEVHLDNYVMAVPFEGDTPDSNYGRDPDPADPEGDDLDIGAGAAGLASIGGVHDFDDFRVQDELLYGEQDIMDCLNQFLEETSTDPRIRPDPTRIYLSGASMGGLGTYTLGLHNPQTFAALHPTWGATDLYEGLNWIGENYPDVDEVEPSYPDYLVDLMNGIVKSSDAGANWNMQNASNNKLSSVSAVDAQTSWVAGDGTCLKTTNGGTSWQEVYSLPTTSITDIGAVSSQTAWRIGYQTEDNVTHIFKTTDGGATWGLQYYLPYPSLFTSVSAVDAQTAWVAGNGKCLRTTNGGTSWQEVYSLPTTSITDIGAVSSQTAWRIGYQTEDNVTHIFKTTDGGATWGLQYYLPYPERFNAVSAADSQTAWVVGDGGMILKTFNGGASWAEQTSNQTANLTDVCAVNASIAWAVGDGGIILYTSDGGTSWTVQQASRPDGQKDTDNYSGVSAVSGSTAWAVGANSEQYYAQQDSSIMEAGIALVGGMPEEDMDDRLLSGMHENSARYILENALNTPIRIEQPEYDSLIPNVDPAQIENEQRAPVTIKWKDMDSWNPMYTAAPTYAHGQYLWNKWNTLPGLTNCAVTDQKYFRQTFRLDPLTGEFNPNWPDVGLWDYTDYSVNPLFPWGAHGAISGDLLGGPIVDFFKQATTKFGSKHVDPDKVAYKTYDNNHNRAWWLTTEVAYPDQDNPGLAMVTNGKKKSTGPFNGAEIHVRNMSTTTLDILDMDIDPYSSMVFTLDNVTEPSAEPLIDTYGQTDLVLLGQWHPGASYTVTVDGETVTPSLTGTTMTIPGIDTTTTSQVNITVPGGLSNLLLNPGFEDVPWWVLANWNSGNHLGGQGGEGLFELSGGTGGWNDSLNSEFGLYSHRGGRSVRIQSAKAYGSYGVDEDYISYWASDPVTITPGYNYTASSFLMTRSLDSNNREVVDGAYSTDYTTKAGVGILWLDANNNVIELDKCDGISGSNFWSPVEVGATAPQGATKAKVILFSNSPDNDGANGSVWFDDAALR